MRKPSRNIGTSPAKRWREEQHKRALNEDRVFGRVRAKSWMKGTSMGEESSRLQTKVHRDAATTFREKHAKGYQSAGLDFPPSGKLRNFSGKF